MTEFENHDEDNNENIVALSKPKFPIGSIVAFVRDETQVAMVRGYNNEGGAWYYTLTHAIDGMQQVTEADLSSYQISSDLLQRFAELYLLTAQRSYRSMIESKEFDAGIKLTQYSDTHDTVITHRVVGGSGYGPNSVTLEGSDLLELTDTAKWDVYKRQQLAPKQLTRYRG